MKSAFESWPEIVSRLRGAKGLFLALDFDGVLSPIAARPDLANLPLTTRELLEQFIACPFVRTGIISGRALLDVKARVGLSGVVFAGNHGAEIDLNGLATSRGIAQDCREQLSYTWNQLNELFSGLSGILLEDKGLGVGIHYREIDPSEVANFHQRFVDWAQSVPASLEIMHGKKMYEIRPKGSWNKGDALSYIWDTVAHEFLPMFMGDDLTDEDGFRALQGKGITIYVGEEKQSYAQYNLPSQQDVVVFLGRLLAEAKGHAESSTEGAVESSPDAR